MEGKPVIVEGKKDMLALRRCGIKRIVMINGRPSELCRLLEGANEAVILTDFDQRGDELLEIISGHLRSYGIRPNVECRRRLRYSLGLQVFQEIDRRLCEFENEMKEL